MPLGELMTGMRRRWTSSVNCGPASDSVTPWPMKNAGRFAVEIIATAVSMSAGEAPLRRTLTPAQVVSRSTSASS